MVGILHTANELLWVNEKYDTFCAFLVKPTVYLFTTVHN